MPLIFSRKISENAQLGAWHLTESLDELMEKVNRHHEIITDSLNDLRKKQRLSMLLLIKELTGNESGIQYDSYGKPFLKDSPHFISVAHTQNYVVLIINASEPTGIDIEQPRPALLNIKNRFLSDKELEDVKGSDSEEILCIYWCAKEALYKLYGKKELIFREDLQINPFHYPDKSYFTGIIQKNGKANRYLMAYEQLDNHWLVYSLNQELNVNLVSGNS